VRPLACLVALLLAGCKSLPPAEPVSLESFEPERWKDQRITLTGRVDALEWAIGDAGSFTFHLVGDRGDPWVLCSESGYNVLILSEVVNLLESAQRRGVPVTVTGTLKTGPSREIVKGSRLEVDRVEVERHVVNTDYRDYYRYPDWAVYGGGCR